MLELVTLVPRLFGTTARCLSVQPVQLLPSRNIWRHISLIWPFPNRYRHSPRHVDVTELFPRSYCWTLIWLLRQWAWLRQGYWLYRSVIDWLIDWFLLLFLVVVVVVVVVLQQNHDRHVLTKTMLKSLWFEWGPTFFVSISKTPVPPDGTTLNSQYLSSLVQT